MIDAGASFTLGAMSRSAPDRAAPTEGSLSESTIAVPATDDTDGIAASFARAGASVWRFEEPDPPEHRAVERWLADLSSGTFDTVVFFSAQGVRVVCEIARELGRQATVSAALRQVRLVAAGARTARALKEFGLHAEVYSATQGIDALVRTVSFLDLKGHTVALQPGAPEGACDLAHVLERRGATVHDATRDLEPDRRALGVLEAVLTRGIDGVVLTTERQVAWLWGAARATGREPMLPRELERTVVFASDAAAEALRSQSVSVARTPADILFGRPRVEDVVALFHRLLPTG